VKSLRREKINVECPSHVCSLPNAALCILVQPRSDSGRRGGGDRGGERGGYGAAPAYGRDERGGGGGGYEERRGGASSRYDDADRQDDSCDALSSLGLAAAAATPALVPMLPVAITIGLRGAHASCMQHAMCVSLRPSPDSCAGLLCARCVCGAGMPIRDSRGNWRCQHTECDGARIPSRIRKKQVTQGEHQVYICDYHVHRASALAAKRKRSGSRSPEPLPLRAPRVRLSAAVPKCAIPSPVDAAEPRYLIRDEQRDERVTAEHAGWAIRWATKYNNGLAEALVAAALKYNSSEQARRQARSTTHTTEIAGHTRQTEPAKLTTEGIALRKQFRELARQFALDMGWVQFSDEAKCLWTGQTHMRMYMSRALRLSSDQRSNLSGAAVCCCTSLRLEVPAHDQRARLAASSLGQWPLVARACGEVHHHRALLRDARRIHLAAYFPRCRAVPRAGRRLEDTRAPLGHHAPGSSAVPIRQRYARWHSSALLACSAARRAAGGGRQ
jgi:hypothetical protein